MYLRIPDDLRERIRQEAEVNGRSLTGEIVFKLRLAYQLPADTIREDGSRDIRHPTEG